MNRVQTNGHADPPSLRNGRSDERVSIDRLPPHSHEAEQGVLGCILIAPVASMIECQARITADAFYDLRHRAIYEACVALHDVMKPVDLILLDAELSAGGMLAQVGGLTYLTTLADSVPSAANLSYYLDELEEKHQLRKLIATCTDLVGRAYECADTEALIDQAEREVLSVRTVKAKNIIPIKEIVHQSIEEIEKCTQMNGQITGLSTGLIDVDKATDGLHPGEVTVISALPSTGKTSCAMNIAEHVLLCGHHAVAVFSLEMTAVSLVTRFICSHARVNLRNIKEGFISERDYPKITGTAAKVSNSALWIDDTSDLTIGQIRAKARRLHQQHGIRLVVIDYIQLIEADKTTRRNETRADELRTISKGIKQMAKELNVSVIVLSQLTTFQGGTKLRGAAEIGQDADCIWKLSRDKDAEKNDNNIDSEHIELWIQKQRNGPRDVRIPLIFFKCFTRFESASRISPEDAPNLI